MAESFFNPSSVDYRDTHGDSWQRCYCNIAGNSLTVNGLERNPHTVNDMDYHPGKIVYGRNYKNVAHDKSSIEIIPCTTVLPSNKDLVPLRLFPLFDSPFVLHPILNACISILSIEANQIVSNVFSTFDSNGKFKLMSVQGIYVNCDDKTCLGSNRAECISLIERSLVSIRYDRDNGPSTANGQSVFDRNNSRLVSAKMALLFQPNNENICNYLTTLMA